LRGEARRPLVCPRRLRGSRGDVRELSSRQQQEPGARRSRTRSQARGDRDHLRRLRRDAHAALLRLGRPRSQRDRARNGFSDGPVAGPARGALQARARVVDARADAVALRLAAGDGGLHGRSFRLDHGQGSARRGDSRVPARSCHAALRRSGTRMVAGVPCAPQESRVVNVEDIYPLSPLQQGLLFETLNSPGSGVYVGQFCWDLDGTVHADAMHEAWQAVVDRHPALRTGFIWEDTSEPHQLVERAVSVPWEEADWRASHESTQEERLRALFADDRAKGFDLANPPLTRLRLIRVAESRWKLFWSHHHLILDGWSLPILMADAARFYNARLEGRSLDLDPPPPYSRHIAWLKSRDVSAARAFW